MSERHIDGYSRQSLLEGHVKKGGKNPTTSQIRERPPAPAPLRPSSPGNAGQQGTTTPTSSNQK